MMRKVISVLCLTSFASLADAPSRLEGAKSYKDGAAHVTELQFHQPVDANNVSVEFINETIQVNVRGAEFAKGKMTQDITDEKLKQVFVYQVEPLLVRARVILKKPALAQDYEGYVKVESKENKLIVTVADPMAVAAAPTLVVPPVDLNSVLEPKISTPELSAKTSAASILEGEFLTGRDAGATPFVPTVIDSSKAESDEAKENSQQQKSVLKESEIPVRLNVSPKAANSENPWTRMILSLAVISVVGIVAIVVAKRYAKAKIPGASKVQIQVVSQQALGPKRSLMVVRVAGEDILIGVTDYNVSLIKSLSLIDDEIETEVPRSFVDELNQVTDRYVSYKAVTRPDLKRPPHGANEDEFNMGKIKDMVASKLKEMRPL